MTGVRLVEILSNWYSTGVDSCPKNSHVVVVDALRFSCTVIRALQLGLEEVIVVETPRELIELSEKYDNMVTAGELDGMPIEHADADNSPTELAEIILRKKKGARILGIRTSSGAQVFIKSVKQGYKTIIGSFINAKSLAGYLLKNAEIACIIMAGYKNSSFSLDDFLAAGYIVHNVIKLQPESIRIDEQLIAAYLAYTGISGLDNLREIIKRTRSFLVLVENNKVADLYECITPEDAGIVPFADRGPVIRPIFA